MKIVNLREIEESILFPSIPAASRRREITFFCIFSGKRVDLCKMRWFYIFQLFHAKGVIPSLKCSFSPRGENSNNTKRFIGSGEHFRDFSDFANLHCFRLKWWGFTKKCFFARNAKLALFAPVPYLFRKATILEAQNLVPEQHFQPWAENGHSSSISPKILKKCHFH